LYKEEIYVSIITMDEINNYSVGAKRRWSTVDKETRSKIMSDRRRKGWAKKTAEERSDHAKKISRIRWDKTELSTS
jgi:hypothetical protein